MRNRNSANLPPQTDRSTDSSTFTPPAGFAQESTGGSLMEEQATTNTKQKKKGGAGLNIMIVLFALVLLGGIGLSPTPRSPTGGTACTPRAQSPGMWNRSTT